MSDSEAIFLWLMDKPVKWQFTCKDVEAHFPTFSQGSVSGALNRLMMNDIISHVLENGEMAKRNVGKRTAYLYYIPKSFTQRDMSFKSKSCKSDTSRSSGYITKGKKNISSEVFTVDADNRQVHAALLASKVHQAISNSIDALSVLESLQAEFKKLMQELPDRHVINLGLIPNKVLCTELSRRRKLKLLNDKDLGDVYKS